MKAKLFFVSSYASHFVLEDLEILQKHFRVEKLILAGKSKSNFQKMINSIEIIFAVMRHDIVYCWFADFSSFIAVLLAWILNKKSVIMVGGYETSNLPNYGGMQSRSAKYIRFAIKKADTVITVSNFIAKEMINLNLREDPRVIHLATTYKNFKTQKKKIIVTCGSATENLYKIKGIDIFVRATTNLKSYKKIVIGEFDPNVKDELLKSNPDLEFAGRMAHADFLTLLSETEIYCQFSRRESFGMALLEALNCNCKAVISNCGALPEVAGDKAIIADINVIESCRAAIKKNLIRQIPDNKKWITKNFSLQKREQNLLKILENLE